MTREDLISRIVDALGTRDIVWFGTRGTDAEPLDAFGDRFRAVFSQIAPLQRTSWGPEREACLETITGRRVDLNSYNIDLDGSPAVRELHKCMMRELNRGSAIAAYRSCHFLSAASYSRQHGLLLGMFAGKQAAFEHKPWVETELRDRGVRTIPWEYFTDSDWDDLVDRPRDGWSVLRASYTDGGLGVRILGPGEDPGGEAPRLADRLMALSPLLRPSVPLNVGGCAFPDGTVTVHTPSIQLIGVREFTNHDLGYCGNDFAGVATVLPRVACDSLEAMVTAVGKWLVDEGYFGAFGIDALYCGDGTLYLTEVNPRFQGSSAVSADIGRRMDTPDIYLDHIAACVGVVVRSARPSLYEQAVRQASSAVRQSQVVCYATGESEFRRNQAVVPDMPFLEVRGAPRPETIVEPNGMLFKLIVEQSITSDGTSVDSGIRRVVQSVAESLFEPTI